MTKNPDAVALGRKGGLKGGRARADSMTPEERSEAASKAAKARWSPEDDYPMGLGRKTILTINWDPAVPAELVHEFSRARAEELSEAMPGIEQVRMQVIGPPRTASKKSGPKTSKTNADKRPKRYTNEEIIQAIQGFHAKNNRPPTHDDWIAAADGRPTANTIGNRFGSWANAIEAAGFPRPASGGRNSLLSEIFAKEMIG